MKDIILWNYERASWQWDLLCVLIMLFIFLTPKAWFDKREATQVLRSAVKVQDFSPAKIEVDRRIKDLSDKPSAEILNRHEKQNAQGETFYAH